MADERLAIVVKGFPRLSETFVARELEALEDRGVTFSLHALRRPGMDASLTRYRVSAQCNYLPEYLRDELGTVLKAFMAARGLPGFGAAFNAFRADLLRDFSRARFRRFGQACVLATSVGKSVRHLHVHFAHSPASVTRYAARMLGITYSISSHAKDVWTDPEWDLRNKLREAAFVCICNRAAHSRLAELMPTDRLHLIHHGIDGAVIAKAARAQSRDGSLSHDPVRLVTVARAVEKKGLRVVLEALALLPRTLNFHWDHFGDGEERGKLKKLAVRLSLDEKITWHGAVAHDAVIRALDESDMFLLPAEVALSGDRDGIPNALLEAKARGVCIVACDAGGVGEAVTDGETGRLVRDGDVVAFARAVQDCMTKPALRQAMATEGLTRDVALFDAATGHDRIATLLRERIGT